MNWRLDTIAVVVVEPIVVDAMIRYRSHYHMVSFHHMELAICFEQLDWVWSMGDELVIGMTWQVDRKLRFFLGQLVTE